MNTQTSSSFSLRGVANLSLSISAVLLALHIYYFCYPMFDHWGWTVPIGDRILTHIAATHLFDSLLRCKILIALFMVLSLVGYAGKKDQDASMRECLKILGLGLLLYFGSFVLFARLGSVTDTGFWYILITVAGWLLMLKGGAGISRVLRVPRAADDPFGKRRGGFPQEEKLVSGDDSLHLRGEYTLENKRRDSWINLLNPRRGVLVIGSPGSGKSYFIIEPLIRQWMEKRYPIFVYDFKFPDLSLLTYRLFQHYAKGFPAGTAFFCINFTDLSRSHRCNVLEASTLEGVDDAIEASRTILLSMNKSWIHKQGEFFVESPINLLAAVIWFLRKYQDGRYCTLPHAIELIQVEYSQLLTILRCDADVEGLIKSFVDAYNNKSFQQLDGQMASAKIPLGRLSSPTLYYILTGNDLSLAINDPAAPKVLCLGGDVARREALAPVLSLYIDQLNRVCNAPRRLPCAIVCDEFPTVRAMHMLNSFATARSNKIVPVVAVQDVSQVRLTYTREEAEMLLNISGNFFCGQTGGDTAQWVSARFPKVLKDRQSVSTNSTDTSVSVTPQWEETVTTATIAGLSSGEFVGLVADDPGKEAELKAFHSRLLRQEMPELGEGELPVVRTVKEEELEEHFLRIRKDIEDLVEEERVRINGNGSLRQLVLK